MEDGRRKMEDGRWKMVVGWRKEPGEPRKSRGYLNPRTGNHIASI